MCLVFRRGKDEPDTVLVLALDTTSRGGSVALVADGRILLVRAGDSALTHGQRLPGDFLQILTDAGASTRDLDLLAVAAGPGSFTGLRVGIAAIQGLAMALDRRVVAVSALQALAHAARAGTEPIATWMDAQRGEVYAALFDQSGRQAIEPTALTPSDTLNWWRDRLPPGPVRFVGEGAIRYESEIRSGRADARIASTTPLLAGTIGQIATMEADRAVLPHAIVPLYVRRSDAELARLRRDQRR